ncbi:MAG: SDR family NAD(P)-dependent oxidoreductase, partial [Nitrospirota bacterium]|nr:SDR family NAD(P)-dependent oxidoreductase [Nitrospirota bacterium]
MRLQGKVAIVTGGGCGFGEGIATRFAVEGCKVLVADIEPERAARVANAITAAGGQAQASTADVSRRSDFERMVSEAKAAFGNLDLVVNN